VISPAPPGFRAPAWTRWEVVVFAGLVALALGTHLWDLQHVPWSIHPDEPDMGAVVLDSYLGGRPAPVFATLWENAELPALWFLAMAASLDVGGITLAALRVPSALVGALAVIPFYGLVRGVWGRAAAIGGTLLFACSMADTHYSRVTLNNIAPSFFWMVCFFFLMSGLRGRRPLDWALAGLAGGLGEYTYYGNRLLPFVLAALAGYLLVVHWRQGRRLLGQWALLAASYLVAFGPLLAYFQFQRPDLNLGRGKSMLTWDHLPVDWADFQAMVRTLWALFSTNLLAISTNPSVDGVYWSPLLLLGEAVLLVLGTALLIRQWRHPAAFLLLTAGLGVLFVGGTLTRGTGIGPPFLAHWTPAFPVFYAAMAAPLGAWAASWRGAPPRLRLLGPALAGAAVLLLAGLSLQTYYQQYVEARPANQHRSMLGRWAAGLGPGYRVYTLGRTWQPFDPDLHQYLIAGQEGAALLNPARDLPLPPAPGKGAAFAFANDNTQYGPIVEAFYPGGQWEDLRADDGRVLFTTYRVAAEQVAAAPPAPAGQGLQVALADEGGAVTTRVDPFVAFSAITPARGGPVPPDPVLRARWAGELLVTQPGEYLLELRTDGAAGLALDAAPGPAECRPGGVAIPVTLAAGAHPLRIDFSARAGQRLLEFYWTPPGSPRALVPPAALRVAAPGAAPPPAPVPPTTPPCGGQ
jgi:hypothetical protein